MITRLAPWQRINVALARGILLKASGQMKWIANCTAFSVSPNAGAPYSMFPIEADNEFEAARIAARGVAQLVYGFNGEASFINAVEAPYIYRANIGVYQGGGKTKGQSLEILIREYRGMQ